MKRTFISKTDLAVAYFPYVNEHSARHKLMGIIDSDAKLMESLSQSGYIRTSRQFSPKQVDIIFDHLGNPYKGS